MGRRICGRVVVFVVGCPGEVLLGCEGIFAAWHEEEFCRLLEVRVLRELLLGPVGVGSLPRSRASELLLVSESERSSMMSWCCPAFRPSCFCSSDAAQATLLKLLCSVKPDALAAPRVAARSKRVDELLQSFLFDIRRHVILQAPRRRRPLARGIREQEGHVVARISDKI